MLIERNPALRFEGPRIKRVCLRTAEGREWNNSERTETRSGEILTSDNNCTRHYRGPARFTRRVYNVSPSCCRTRRSRTGMGLRQTHHAKEIYLSVVQITTFINANSLFIPALMPARAMRNGTCIAWPHSTRFRSLPAPGKRENWF